MDKTKEPSPVEIIEQINLDPREVGSDKPLKLSSLKPIDKFNLDSLDQLFKEQSAKATASDSYFKVVIGRCAFFFRKEDGGYDGWEYSFI